MICIKNGTLHTAVTRETFVADIPPTSQRIGFSIGSPKVS